MGIGHSAYVARHFQYRVRDVCIDSCTLSDLALTLTPIELCHLLRELRSVVESYRQFDPDKDADTDAAPRSARTATVQVQAFLKPGAGPDRTDHEG